MAATPKFQLAAMWSSAFVDSPFFRLATARPFPAVREAWGGRETLPRGRLSLSPPTAVMTFSPGWRGVTVID